MIVYCAVQNSTQFKFSKLFTSGISCVTLGLLFAAVTKTVESTVVDRKGRGRESSDHACATITLLTVELLAQP